MLNRHISLMWQLDEDKGEETMERRFEQFDNLLKKFENGEKLPSEAIET